MEDNYCSQTAQEQLKKLWQDLGINSFDTTDTTRPVYSIDTPPPTVSGNLHIGHVFSYTHTDFLARYRRMQGYNVYYPMGFDDNGLPTERYVEKKHKTKAHLLGRSTFIKLCLEEVKESHKAFGALWQALGLSIDWNFTYSTISDLARRVAQKNFLELLKQKRVYRCATAALYCTTCQTSVAQAELDSLECKTTFNTILFSDEQGTPLPVATTRPELLPACVAVLFNPADTRYQHLAGKTVHSPYFNTPVPCIADEDVLPDKGTGLVMCCTFGDQTDITWFERHKLPLKTIMDERGVWLESTGPLAGKRAPEARAAIIELLRAASLITEEKPLVHAVNVHERCKQPIEYRVIPQWFVRLIDQKELFLSCGEEITWHPAFMQARYRDWVSNLGWDWCISRQRFYGVPFPVWHCKKCAAVLTAPEEMLPIDPSEQAYPGSCSCGSNDIAPEMDVMDTWNISSLTPQINQVMVQEKSGAQLPIPFSLRPQAHDIIRTWAFDTIVKTAYSANTIPWQEIVISGHVTQGSGKISKSAGDAATTPQSLLAAYPADAIRYWAGKAHPGVDTVFSEEQIKGGVRLQTKLWNAFRFIKQQEPLKPTAPQALDAVNQWIVGKLEEATAAQHAAFEQAEYAKALEAAETFFWKEFCDNYLELIKDRFFNPARYSDLVLKATRETLYLAGLRILKLYAPFVPFITETLYQEFYKAHECAPSVHSHLLQKADDLASLALTGNKTAAQELLSDILLIVNEVRRGKSSAQVSLKTPIKMLVVSAQSPEKQQLILQEEATIMGITKAEQLTVNANQNQLESLRVSMVLAEQAPDGEKR